MKKILFHLLRMSILFIVCGSIYYSIETIYKYPDSSHWSMFILSGFLSVFFIDTPNNIYSYDMDIKWQVLISSFFCILGEGLCGLYVNVYKGWSVWNYEGLIGSYFWNQNNIFFNFAWILLSFIGIIICDCVNYYFFKIDPAPYYQIKGKIFLRFPERKNK